MIFCRGVTDSRDGACVDLVVDLAAVPDWRIADVRYCGFPSDRWHHAFVADDDLEVQLAGLAQGLPQDLA